MSYDWYGWIVNDGKSVPRTYFKIFPIETHCICIQYSFIGKFLCTTDSISIRIFRFRCWLLLASFTVFHFNHSQPKKTHSQFKLATGLSRHEISFFLCFSVWKTFYLNVKALVYFISVLFCPFWVIIVCWSHNTTNYMCSVFAAIVDQNTLVMWLFL